MALPTGHERPAPARLPSSAYAVLGLLALGGEHTAYELKQRADRMITPFFVPPAMSAVYTELNRLAELGLAADRHVPETENRSKRVFRITEAGHDELSRWVCDHIHEPTIVKSPTMLRVAFGHVGDPEALWQLVTCHARWAATEAERVRGALAASDGDGGPPGHSRLVLEWAAERIEAEAEASERLAERLRELTTQPGAANGEHPVSGVSGG